MNTNIMVLRAARIAKRMNDVVREYHGQKESTRRPSGEAVLACISNKFDPIASWERWKADMYEEGWKYGEEYDESKKTHPNLIDKYDDLPFKEKVKDYVFYASINAIHQYEL